MCCVISWVALIWFGVLELRSGMAELQHTSNQINATHEITQYISCKLLRMDVLTSETY